MNEYIDADKLIGELRRQKRELELSIQSLGYYGQTCPIIAYENIIPSITSLRNRPKASDNWKPSEEQMKAFKDVIISIHDFNLAETLLSLRVDRLKKLM